MKERKDLEYKEQVSNTFLKTVSAFSNYEGGTIIFGIADNGKVVGVADPKATCQEIENKINDSITPHPDYSLRVKSADHTVILTVEPGLDPPYLYKSKAYKRNDTATIEVESLEFSRLVLRGKNLRYEELPTTAGNLTFRTLEEKLKSRVGIETFSMDILKTLMLYSDRDGYNHAAEILADKNSCPGIDMARFGENISIIHKRETFDRNSVLENFDRAMGMFRDYYQYEEITEATRRKVERIPEAAFREAIANALIHRTWDIASQIVVYLFEDRIEVTSPGGLPEGITEKEYLAGMTSVLRNPILANVFYRLGIVEIFGTGVLRIQQAYADSAQKPIFEIRDNSLKVTLPVLEPQLGLTEDEKQVYHVLSKTRPKSMSEIVQSVDFGKSKVSGVLKAMYRRGLISMEGNGRGTKYFL